MNTLSILVVCFLTFYSVLGKPNPFPKAPTTTAIPDLVEDTNNATTPIWLRFLKNKKIHTTTELPSPLKPNKSLGKLKNPPPLILSSNKNAPVITSDARRSIPSDVAPTNSLDEVLDRIAEYFHITPAPNGYLSGDAIAQDRQANPDTLYDQMYLDWIRKREVPQTATPMPQTVPVQPEEGMEDLNANSLSLSPAAAAVGNPQVAPLLPSYPYPAAAAAAAAVPFAYSPFFPSLAGFKMQKAMVQAQLDAGLASLGFTTTPKPIKLKLKIQLPGLTDITEIGKITTALNANLPPGSVLELA